MRRFLVLLPLFALVLLLAGCSLFPSYIRGGTETDLPVSTLASTETTVAAGGKNAFVRLPDTKKIVNINLIIYISESPDKVWTDSSTQQDRYKAVFVDGVELQLTENDYKILRAAVMGE